MRQGIYDDLFAYERTQAKKASRKEMEEKLGEANPINIPEKLVKEQIAFMVNKEQQAAHGYIQWIPQRKVLSTADTITPEDEKKHREGAIKILQQELVIGQLSDDFNVEVSEQDLNREMTSFAQIMGSDLKKLKKEWSAFGSALLRLHSRMRREKTLDQLIDQVKVTEEMVDRSALEVNN